MNLTRFVLREKHLLFRLCMGLSLALPSVALAEKPKASGAPVVYCCQNNQGKVLKTKKGKPACLKTSVSPDAPDAEESVKKKARVCTGREGYTWALRERKSGAKEATHDPSEDKMIKTKKNKGEGSGDMELTPDSRAPGKK